MMENKSMNYLFSESIWMEINDNTVYILISINTFSSVLTDVNTWSES